MPVVMADPVQIAKILTNLVSIATWFWRPGEPQGIHVGAQRIDGFWDFSVADNAIGVEEECFDRIFVSFHGLYTKDRNSSTGSGPSIVAQIIDRQGGRIVSSRRRERA